MAIRLDHGTDELVEVHDINVTPFIDVVLVLLIIFMVAAPLATVDVAVDLPSLTVPPQQRPPKPVYLTLKADGSLALGDNPVPRDALADILADGHQRRQGRAYLPARRPCSALWRRHGTDERPAPGRLSQSRFGRNGNPRGKMTALALPWFEDEDPRDLRRWAMAALIVFGIHAGGVAGYLYFHQPEEIGDAASPLAFDLAPADDSIDQPEVAPVPEEQRKEVEQQQPPPEPSQAVIAPPEEQQPADRTSEAAGAGGSGAGQRRRSARRAIMADRAGTTLAAIQALSERRPIARRGWRGAVELHGRSHRPRAGTANRAQLRSSRTRQRSYVDGRARPAAATISAQHAAGQARPDSADPLFAALTPIAYKAKTPAETAGAFNLNSAATISVPTS